MEKVKPTINDTDEIKSIEHALQTLNDAAKDSSREIKSMVDRDYRKLKSVLADVKPEVKHAFRELGDASQQQLSEVKETVDESVRKHPWLYVGGATAIAGLLGYVLGRRSC
ncbi:MAG: DUF883 domain-containing protein [Bdellovibrionales bacterium]|nr:DUF883 domain-containing protein [Bdellovibrionales bacterium]